jgi:hypothetical protein
MTKVERKWICPWCAKPHGLTEGVLEHVAKDHAAVFKVFPNPLIPPQNIFDMVD